MTDAQFSSHSLTTRRHLLSTGTALAGATLLMAAGAQSAADAVAAAPPANAGKGRLDFRNPLDNVYGLLKLQSSFGDRPVYPAFRGVTFARVGDRPLRPLFGYEGFSTLRAELLPNGHARWWGKEIAFYTDLNTGEPLERWVNPLNGATVEPMHFLNDRQLAEFGDTMLEIRFPGQPEDEPAAGFYNPNLTEADRRASDGKLPFRLPWFIQGDLAMLTLEAPISYPNPLDPKEWRREWSGPRINPTESYSFCASLAELEDRSRPSALFTGGFARIAPWWPWMLMGQSEGVLFTRAHMWKRTHGLDNVSSKILAVVEKRYPEYLEVPTKWEKDSNPSTWELYKQRRKPIA